MAPKSTPRERLQAEGKLDPHVIAVRAGGKTVDLHTPIDAGTAITPIRDTDPEGLAVIRHSTAHVMADAVQRLFPGTHVTIGPAIEDGFYYDFEKPGSGFTDEDLRRIEEVMIGIVAKDSPFRRDVISRERAIEMFEKMGEHFKVEIIRSIPADEEVSLYAPARRRRAQREVGRSSAKDHTLPTTGFLKAVKLTHRRRRLLAGRRAQPDAPAHLPGTLAFPSEASPRRALAPHRGGQARETACRKLGKELDLILFDHVAPAMPFFLPKGAFVYNRMVQYLRDLYEAEGYEEVITPQIFDPSLFRTSGYLGNYNENMYRLWTEDELDDVDDLPKVKAPASYAPACSSARSG